MNVGFVGDSGGISMTYGFSGTKIVAEWSLSQMAVFRDDLQKLARLRRRDALFLLNHGRYSASYYCSGFSIECAIKACIAKSTKVFEFPDKKKAEQSWKHELKELIAVAGLQAPLAAARKVNAALDGHWSVVAAWNNERRYDRLITKQEAHDIYKSVASKNGVLAWIRGYW